MFLFILFFTAAHFHLGSRQYFSFSHRRYIIFGLKTVKAMLHGTIRNDDFSSQQRCNTGTMMQKFETMMQRCVALKITVANRLI